MADVKNLDYLVALQRYGHAVEILRILIDDKVITSDRDPEQMAYSLEIQYEPESTREQYFKLKAAGAL